MRIRRFPIHPYPSSQHPLALTIAVLICAISPWLKATAADLAPSHSHNVELQLLGDPQFNQGFLVDDPQPGAHVVRGIIQPFPGNPPSKPIWTLAQWSCRHSLAGAIAETLPNGGLRFSDAGKSVTFGPKQGEDRGLVFSLSGNVEYDGKLRSPDAPWVHLLCEQEIAGHPKYASLSQLRFQLSARLLQAKSWLAKDQEKPWHAAQFLAYVTLQDRNPSSAHKGDFLWFGIQVYDNRYRVPQRHAALDPGTGKFIFNPPGSAYTDASAHDGGWVRIDRDLLPLMREGLVVARGKGWLKDSPDSDLEVGSFNMGWELPGLLDVAVQFRDLGLFATEKENPGITPGSPKQTK